MKYKDTTQAQQKDITPWLKAKFKERQIAINNSIRYIIEECFILAKETNSYVEELNDLIKAYQQAQKEEMERLLKKQYACICDYCMNNYEEDKIIMDKLKFESELE